MSIILVVTSEKKNTWTQMIASLPRESLSTTMKKKNINKIYRVFLTLISKRRMVHDFNTIILLLCFLFNLELKYCLK